MVRTLVFGLSLCAACGLVVGCDTAKKLGDSAKDVGEKLSEEAAKTLKADTLKPIEDALPAITDKIKALPADAQAGAQKTFDALKQLVADFKAAPADKLKDMARSLVGKFEELKKMVGL